MNRATGWSARPNWTSTSTFSRSAGGAADDYLLLRDHLCHHPADRQLYERTKRSLAAMEWRDMNAYADAKTDVITEIKNRARQQDRG